MCVKYLKLTPVVHTLYRFYGIQSHIFAQRIEIYTGPAYTVCATNFKETNMDNQQKHNKIDTTIAVDEILWRSGLALTAAELRKVLSIPSGSTVVPTLGLYGKTVKLVETSYVIL